MASINPAENMPARFVPVMNDFFQYDHTGDRSLVEKYTEKDIQLLYDAVHYFHAEANRGFAVAIHARLVELVAIAEARQKDFDDRRSWKRTLIITGIVAAATILAALITVCF